MSWRADVNVYGNSYANQLISSENESMKLEPDREIENLLLQINTGNVEISHIYPDRDAADEMNIKMLKFAKMKVKSFKS